ncbi:MAG: hypothetical protein Q9208_005426 [Pyrenodesmia sp. 3 TL-2023]
MASAVESPLRSSSLNKSGRSTPKPHPPATTPVTATESSSEAQALLAVFNDFTQSVLETAKAQSRWETLRDDERNIEDEHDRWSRYFDTYVSIGEDQNRTLKATKTAKEKSHDQLNQAKTRGERATKKIVRSILAASAGKSSSAVEHEQIASLKDEIASLRKSVVDVKSDYHRLAEVADIQQHHIHQLRGIRDDIRDGQERHNDLNKEVVDVSTQLKKLPTLNSVHDGVKRMADIQNRHLDSVKSELELKIKSLRESVENDGGKVTPAMLSKLEAELAVSKEGLSTLQESDVTKDRELRECRALLSSLQQETASNQKSVKQLDDRETVNSTEAKVHQQAVMQEAKSICENSQQVLETCTGDIEKLRKDHEALGIRCDSIQQMLESRQNEQPSASHTLDVRTDLSNVSHRLGEMEELYDALSKTVERAKASEDERDDAIGGQIDQFNDILLQQSKQFANQGSELVDLKDRVTRIGDDQSLEKINADIRTLNDAIDAIKDQRTAQQPFLDQLHSNVSLLQRQASLQPQAQPSPSPSLNGFKDDVQPKIEALESGIRNTVDKVKAIETVQASYEQRWSNVTTEPIVQSVVYYIQQRYPLHALQDGQREIIQRQNQLERVQEGHRNHVAQLQELVNKDRGQDLKRISELEKFTKETAGLLPNIRLAVQNSGNRIAQLDKGILDMGTKMEGMRTTFENKIARLDRCVLDIGTKIEGMRTMFEDQVARVDKSIVDIGCNMKAMKTQEDPTNAQNLAAIQSIKTGVKSLEEKHSSAMDSYRETFSDLKSTVQDLQKTVDGELLSRKAHNKVLNDKVSEVYDVAIKDMVALDQKVSGYQARVESYQARVEAFIKGPDYVAQQEVEETQQNVRETSTEIDAPPGNRGAESESDVPLKVRTKRHTSPSSSNMPPRKKRKGPFSPDDSEVESYKGSQHGSGSPSSVKKSMPGSSQQPVDSPTSSQARRGRPRKPKD